MEPQSVWVNPFRSMIQSFSSDRTVIGDQLRVYNCTHIVAAKHHLAYGRQVTLKAEDSTVSEPLGWPASPYIYYNLKPLCLILSSCTAMELTLFRRENLNTLSCRLREVQSFPREWLE